MTDDDYEYESAVCKEPHEDGTRCMPAWDGYVYICIYRVLKGQE